MAVNDRFKDAPWIDRDIKVVVIGAGGIGSWLTLFLSRIGYNIRVYDHDIFEEHNMGGQFVSRDKMVHPKVNALADLAVKFGGRAISTKDEWYTDESMVGKYVFACTDTMEPRRIAFEKWFKFNSDKKNTDALFIDGRLLMEQMQILCVGPSNTKEYRDKHLFEDSEVVEENCTMKQTSHSAAMIASLMTGFFTNHIANVKLGSKGRVVPFEYEYFIPLNMVSDEFS